MRRLSLATWLGSLAVFLTLGAAPAEARAPRYAVVNIGPSHHDPARRLLQLYGMLSPKVRPVAPGARPASPRAVPRRGPARAVARPTPPARRATPRRATPRRAAVRRAAVRRAAAPLSAPIRGEALRRTLAGLPLDEAPTVAAAALERGKRLFATLKRKPAVEALALAMSLYDNHVGWSRARRALVEACTYLLLCHHALGQQQAARRVAARLRELTGNRAPKGVPADVWSAYPLAPLPLTPRRILKVKAPAQARIYLDDRLAGKGSVELPVGPGAHRLRVERAGHRVFHRLVAAGATGETVLVSLVRRASDAFGDIRAALAKIRRSGKRWDPAPIKRLAQRLRIDHLLLCVVVGGSVKAVWFSARLGKPTGTWLWLPLPGATPTPPTAKLAGPVRAAFAKVRAAERKRAQALAETDSKPKKKSSPKLWKKWYFWVAAALVAGVVAAFAIKDSVTEEKVILRVTRP